MQNFYHAEYMMFSSSKVRKSELRESHSERILRQIEMRFEKYDLVICDEFGYVSFDKNGAELLLTIYRLGQAENQQLLLQTSGSSDGMKYLVMLF